MSLPEANFETLKAKTIEKYSMVQVLKALEEIEKVEIFFKDFDFKKHGSRITAVEFLKLQTKIKDSKKLLEIRRDEIFKAKFG